MTNSSNQKILVISATDLELTIFTKKHSLNLIKQFPSGVNLFSGIMNNISFHLAITGPGVFNTIHGLTLCLTYMKFKTIIQTGIAGVFQDSGLLIGDIAVAMQERYIHTGVNTGKINNIPLPFELIENYLPSREGVYELNSSPTTVCYERLVAKKPPFNVGRGDFITVSAITGSKLEATRLKNAYNPLMESMEGAGAAHVARLYDIPLLEVRAASNWTGERKKTEWQVPLALNRIAWILEQLITMEWSKKVS